MSAIEEVVLWREEAEAALKSVIAKSVRLLRRYGQGKEDGIAKQALACKARRRVSTNKIIKSLQDDVQRRQI
jgi:hypothetical protein